ncbi:MAG TPA: M15 family metallopeptidase [Nocardioides sp.]|uniref:M15 family metallopeptidase n=1 Tax=Nocardioides sp. TaxID=35761 RepID=UPI002CCA8617|nr:M15 family metallopeptidase [Nocardioides sp.]HTW16372.1 M15 family metallopeptidase [Nocardioides sp.]
MTSSRAVLSGALAAVALLASACGTTGAAPEGELPARVDGARQDASVARLDPDLRSAVRAAMRAAREDGVRVEITSGWRSREHQQRLYDEAVARYGSEDEARRYVATPDSSAHVTGDAVDLGPTDALSWLSQHGADFGLCQTFANEMWHYELATTPGGRCPEMLLDGTGRS